MDSVVEGYPAGQPVICGHTTSMRIDADNCSTIESSDQDARTNLSTSEANPSTTLPSHERQYRETKIDVAQNKPIAIYSSLTTANIIHDDVFQETIIAEPLKSTQSEDQDESSRTTPNILTGTVLQTHEKATLSTLPMELLLQIFAPLLVSAMLAKPNWQASASETRLSAATSTLDFRTNYGLFPSVIGVCKQFRSAGELLLYESNIFFVLSTTSPNPSTKIVSYNLTPLNRYAPGRQLTECPAAAKIRNWKVFMPLHRSLRFHPSSLTQFCRAVRYSYPKSLEIILIPYTLKLSWNGSTLNDEDTSDDKDISRSLKSLYMLRGIGKAIIRNAMPSEVENIFFNGPNVDLQPQTHLESTTSLYNELVSLIESTNPVVVGFDMFLSLLRYAQSFERRHNFNGNLPAEKSADPCSCSMAHHSFSCTSCTQSSEKHSLESFWRYQHEPLEASIQRAREASDRNDLEELKEQRSFVMDVLEDQFCEIKNMSDRLNEFIEKEKRSGGVFDVHASDENTRGWYHGSEARMATALLFLENYRRSFDRRFSFQIMIDLRVSHEEGKFSDERLRIFKQLRTAVKLKDVKRFRLLYRAAMNNLDEQYHEIRAARKGIFDFDALSTPIQRIFNFEASRCEEEADRDIIEPRLP